MNSPKVSNLVGPRSWLLFHLLNVSEFDWLRLPAETWEADEGYQRVEAIIRDMPVTNDNCERGVNKVTQYANSAEDGGQRGRIIGVASWHHGEMRGYNKSDLENAM